MASIAARVAQAVRADDHRPAAARIPDDEAVGSAAGDEIGLAEAHARVRSDEERRVGVRPHERRVPRLVLDHLAAERQAQRRVRAGLDPEVDVGLRGGRRERRVDDRHPRTALERVEHEMDVRDAGLDRVRAQQQQEPAVRPVLRLVLGVLDAERDRHRHGQVAVEVEARAMGHAQQRTGPVIGALLDVAGARHLTEHVDRVPAPRLTDPLHLRRDPVEDLVPRRPPELAAATLAGPDQGRLEPVLAVDLVQVGQALHAAARVVCRVGIVGGLLDLDDDPVADERQLAAAAGAVGRAGRPDDAVDGQAGRDLVVAGRQRDLRIEHRQRRADTDRGGGARGTLEERSPVDVAHQPRTLGASGQRGSSIEWSPDPHWAQGVAVVPDGVGRLARAAPDTARNADLAACSAISTAGAAMAARRRLRLAICIRWPSKRARATRSDFRGPRSGRVFHRPGAVN
jgi:hypothetical protein